MLQQAQPYRKGQSRQPGPALSAMLRGRTASGFHPMDAQRALAKRRRPVVNSDRLRALARGRGLR